DGRVVLRPGSQGRRCLRSRELGRRPAFRRPTYGRADANAGLSVARTTAAAPPPMAPALRVVNAVDTGTTLVLSRPGRPEEVLWRGNAWVREIRTGRAEQIDYHAADGRPLTGWLLFPPDVVT